MRSPVQAQPTLIQKPHRINVQVHDLIMLAQPFLPSLKPIPINKLETSRNGLQEAFKQLIQTIEEGITLNSSNDLDSQWLTQALQSISNSVPPTINPQQTIPVLSSDIEILEAWAPLVACAAEGFAKKRAHGKERYDQYYANLSERDRKACEKSLDEVGDKADRMAHTKGTISVFLKKYPAPQANYQVVAQVSSPQVR